jgi:threonine/homoserine/homoserine lactone efflux protein
MTICDGLGLRRAWSAAFAQFIVVAGGSADLRWALVALVLHSLAVVATHFLAWLASLARTAARRIAGKAGRVRDVAPADTTLSVGSR